MTFLTNDNFDDNIKDGIVIVDFFAEWCGPCHALSPVIEELATKYEGKVKIYKLDVDQAPQISAKYNVMSIPTVIFFQNGEEKDKIVGAQPESRYSDKVEELLK